MTILFLEEEELLDTSVDVVSGIIPGIFGVVFLEV